MLQPVAKSRPCFGCFYGASSTLLKKKLNAIELDAADSLQAYGANACLIQHLLLLVLRGFLLYRAGRAACVTQVLVVYTAYIDVSVWELGRTRRR